MVCSAVSALYMNSPMNLHQTCRSYSPKRSIFFIYIYILQACLCTQSRSIYTVRLLVRTHSIYGLAGLMALAERRTLSDYIKSAKFGDDLPDLQVGLFMHSFFKSFMMIIRASRTPSI